MNKRYLFLGNFSVSKGHEGPSVELVNRLRLKGIFFLTASKQQNPLLKIVDMVWAILFKGPQYDTAIIEVYSGWAFLWAEVSAFLTRTLKKNVILVLHGGNIPDYSKRNFNRVARLFSKAVLIISPSLYLKEKLSEIQPDIRVIPNGLNLSAYSIRIRKRVSPSLIWIRSFHEIYNPSMAVRVLAALVKSYPEASLTFVGPDKGDVTLKKVKQLANELNVENKIKFLGPVTKDKIPMLLDQADIFLNTSNIDNMPVSVIEAMACGLCVVSTNAGGLPYFLEDRQDALLVSLGDVSGMAEAVTSLLNDSKLSEKISEIAAKKASAYDWSAVLPLWEQILGQS